MDVYASRDRRSFIMGHSPTSPSFGRLRPWSGASLTDVNHEIPLNHEEATFRHCLRLRFTKLEIRSTWGHCIFRIGKLKFNQIFWAFNCYSPPCAELADRFHDHPWVVIGIGEILRNLGDSSESYLRLVMILSVVSVAVLFLYGLSSSLSRSWYVAHLQVR